MAKKTTAKVSANEDTNVVATQYFNESKDGNMVTGSEMFVGAGATEGFDANDVQNGLVDGSLISFLNPYKSGKGYIVVIKKRIGNNGGNRYKAL